VKETFRLSDEPSRDLIDICKEAYEDMRKFVEEAQSDKWRQEGERTN
jgi:hypothetical protein